MVSGRGSGVRGNGATEHPKGDGPPARLVSLGTVRGAPALQVAWNLPRATVFAATRDKGDAFGPDSVSLAPPRGARSPHVPRDLPRGTADVAEHPKGDGAPPESFSLGAPRGSRTCQVPRNELRATPFAATRAKGDVFGPDPVSLGVSRGTYSSPSSPLLPFFSLPARLSASRKIHSTCAFALRMSSSAQRSTAAQIFGSMRRGYCLRRATNVCSCEC